MVRWLTAQGRQSEKWVLSAAASRATHYRTLLDGYGYWRSTTAPFGAAAARLWQISADLAALNSQTASH